MPQAGMTDAAIAFQCSASLKQAAAQSAMAACEAAHPEIRQLFLQACQEAIQVQAQLTQLMIQRGWYVPLPVGGNTGEFAQNLQQWAASVQNLAPGPAPMGIPGSPGVQGVAGPIGYMPGGGPMGG